MLSEAINAAESKETGHGMKEGIYLIFLKFIL